MFLIPFIFFAVVCVALLAAQIDKERQAQREAARQAEEKKRLAEQEKTNRAAQKAQKETEKKAARRPVGRPRKNPAPPTAQRPEIISSTKEEQQPKPANVRASSSTATAAVSSSRFTGEYVAFTGKLPITRGVACEAVRSLGGTAVPDMPARTTILVVGDNPGNGKLDKFDRWIGNGIRKMTAAEFMRIISQPADQPEPANVRALPPVSAALHEAPTAPQIAEKPQGGEIYSPDTFAAAFAA